MHTEQWAIIVALCGFGLLAFREIRRNDEPRTGADTTSISLLAISLVLAAGIAVRWSRLGQGPFMTLFDILISNLFSLTLIYALLHGGYREARPALPIVLGFLIMLSVWALVTPSGFVPLPPSFDHPWLWVHVLTGKAFLGLCMTAAALSVTGLIGAGIQRRAPAETAVGEQAIWNLCAVAFVFHGAMLVAGAVWANDAWGRYWGWDPLETWSLITWLALAALLHARVTYKLSPRLGWSLVTLVFGLAFLTFFGVPFISQAPHKGVM